MHNFLGGDYRRSTAYGQDRSEGKEFFPHRVADSLLATNLNSCIHSRKEPSDEFFKNINGLAKNQS